MKIAYIIISLLFFCNTLEAQLEVPHLSPLSEIKQKIGLTEVAIAYSRPSSRGRIIFGSLGLLPNKEAWRTGANAATKITFSKPTLIEGTILEKGSYTILSFPEDKLWKIKWYKHTNSNWSFYEDKEAVLELELPVVKLKSKVETFEIRFQNITIDSADIILEWEHTAIEISLKVNENEEILKSIDSALSGPNSFDFYQAAIYLHETRTDLNKALTYIQEATKSEKALFFQVTREAMILQDLGRKKEALKVANRALILSEKVNNDDFIRLNKNIIKAVFN